MPAYALMLARDDGGLFARALDVYFDRPVLDPTNLEGLFDFETLFNMDDLPYFAERLAPGRADAGFQSMHTALRNGLGLKVEPVRERLPVLIVERVEPLIEN